ncbi:MAG: hypothetical protein HY319_19895 [Armatimonadetes bacterium]|nr:hypothetical protein [Armatimonadota bacterium]
MMRIVLLCVLWLVTLSPGLWADTGHPCDRILVAIADYEQAIDRHDLIATLRAQNEAFEEWRKLTSEQRRRVEQEEPGTTLWLEGGADYAAGSSPPRPPVRRLR